MRLVHIFRIKWPTGDWTRTEERGQQTGGPGETPDDQPMRQLLAITYVSKATEGNPRETGGTHIGFIRLIDTTLKFAEHYYK